MSDISLNSFPANRVQALAMLYTQNQDLKGKTPSEIAKIYFTAHYEISTNIDNIIDSAKKDFTDNN